MSTRPSEKESPPLLRPLRTLTLPKVKEFSVPSTIKVGGTVGSLRIASINPTFLKHFAAAVEENVPEAEVRYWTLMKLSGDLAIVEALGGTERAQTHLVRMIQEIKMGRSGPGHFSTDTWGGTPNIHYKISPVDGKLYVVYWYQQLREVDKRGLQVGGGELGFGAHPIPVDLPGWWIGFPVCGG